MTNLIFSLKFALKNESKISFSFLLAQTLKSIFLALSLNLTALIVDEVQKRNFNSRTFILLTITLILNLFLSNLSLILREKIKIRLNYHLKNKLINTFQQIPYIEFENNDFLNNMNLAIEASNDKITNIFLSFSDFLSEIIKFISIFVLVCNLAKSIAALLIILLISTIFLESLSAKIMNKLFQAQSENDRLFKHFEDHCSDRDTMAYLRVMHALDYIRNKINKISNKLIKERIQTTAKASAISSMSRVASLLFLIVSSFILVKQLSLGQISLASFSVVFPSLLIVIETAVSISLQYALLAMNLFYAKHYKNLLASADGLKLNNELSLNTNSIKTYTNPSNISSLAKWSEIFQNWDSKEAIININNLSFSYPNSEIKILDGLNLKIYKSENIALLGRNGSGKTTLTKILLGLYPYNVGSIKVLGHELKSLSRSDISNIFTAIFQDYANYDFSLRENITLSNNDENKDNEIKKKLDFLNLGDISHDLNINLGKSTTDSHDFSQGIWQRIAIARAIIKRSPLLILDEPLSASDPEAEVDLYNKLFIDKERNKIMITHRIGAVREASRILILEDGKIISDGSHEDLINTSSIYQEMIENQKKWYK